MIPNRTKVSLVYDLIFGFHLGLERTFDYGGSYMKIIDRCLDIDRKTNGDIERTTRNIN